MQLARLDKGWIAGHMPHAGRMCLLDEVIAWDEEWIHCLTRSHRCPDNPLRAHGRLGAVCGAEFAAQAMALHCALRQDDSAARQSGAGYLASLRGIELQVARLDDIAADLEVEAHCLAGAVPAMTSLLYGFSLRAGERLLLRGRATVVLEPSPCDEH